MPGNDVFLYEEQRAVCVANDRMPGRQVLRQSRGTELNAGTLRTVRGFSTFAKSVAACSPPPLGFDLLGMLGEVTDTCHSRSRKNATNRLSGWICIYWAQIWKPGWQQLWRFLFSTPISNTAPAASPGKATSDTSLPARRANPLSPAAQSGAAHGRSSGL